MPDPGIEEVKFISTLIDLSKEFQSSLIIPTDDYTAITISKHKTTLNKYYIAGIKKGLTTKIAKPFFKRVT